MVFKMIYCEIYWLEIEKEWEVINVKGERHYVKNLIDYLPRS